MDSSLSLYKLTTKRKKGNEEKDLCIQDAVVWGERLKTNRVLLIWNIFHIHLVYSPQKIPQTRTLNTKRYFPFLCCQKREARKRIRKKWFDVILSVSELWNQIFNIRRDYTFMFSCVSLYGGSYFALEWPFRSGKYFNTWHRFPLSASNGKTNKNRLNRKKHFDILNWYKMGFIGQSIGWNTSSSSPSSSFVNKHSICLHLLCALEYKWMQMWTHKSKIDWANVYNAYQFHRTEVVREKKSSFNWDRENLIQIMHFERLKFDDLFH